MRSAVRQSDVCAAARTRRLQDRSLDACKADGLRRVALLSPSRETPSIIVRAIVRVVALYPTSSYLLLRLRPLCLTLRHPRPSPPETFRPRRPLLPRNLARRRCARSPHRPSLFLLLPPPQQATTRSSRL
jgi:hypothetical protein